jgi:hypothetical protein
MENSNVLPAPASISGPRLAIFDPEATTGPRDQTPEKTPARKRRGKPKSSTQDLPLWQRADGRWCRKIKGRVHYFGTDKEKALAEWAAVNDDLLAGRTPRTKAGGLVLGDLAE